MTDPNKNQDFKFNFNFDSINKGGSNNNTNSGANNNSSNTTSSSGGAQPFKFDFGGSSAAGTAAAGTGGSKPFKFDFGTVAAGDQKDNPFLPVVTDKLNEMIGQSSGFIDSLPPIVQYRIQYLRELNEETEVLDRQMEAEIRAIELKYQELNRPIYLKRRQVISGEVDPQLKPVTDSTPSTTTTSSSTTGEEAADAPHKFASGRPENPENIKGIPEFWLTSLKNTPIFEDAITPDDEEALKFLVDITAELLPEEPNSFRLDFHFATNPFFSNTTLSKTYHMNAEDDSQMCESIDATKVEWSKGKDLVKKQVGEICDGGSFFMFFNPPNIPEEGEEEEGDIERVEMDFTMANTIREMVPSALETYLGEVEGDEITADFFGEEGAELMEEEDDEDEEGDDDYQPAAKPLRRGGGGRGGRGGRGGQRAPEECKQQ
eukprot:TRINITY_DN10632_c0_g1_i1.p1 TRINITY_DN10632_c0_g1~~TRINITY_DN10632_c0_g1_i1.p1  ORF type:complete len:432 (-),score=183.58 TRINITY_DN10632_c0_g1_i1:45-1340(-)